MMAASTSRGTRMTATVMATTRGSLAQLRSRHRLPPRWRIRLQQVRPRLLLHRQVRPGSSQEVHLRLHPRPRLPPRWRLRLQQVWSRLLLHILVAIIGIDTIGVAVLAGLSLPLVKTLGAPVGVRVAGTVLVVAVASSGVVSEGRGVAVGGPLAKTAKFRVIDIG